MGTCFRVRTAIAGGSGGPQLSTMFFSNAGALTAQNAASAVRAFWNDCKGEISSAYVMTVEPEVYVLDTATGQPLSVVSTTTTAVAGTDGGDPLPWATQALIEWPTGIFLGGRQVRGRTFIPGPTESKNTNGVPNGVIIANLNTAASNLVNDVLSDFQIYSRKNGVIEQALAGSTWSKWAILTSRRQ